MTVSSIDLILRNCTTVENLTRRTKIWQLAVYSPKLDQADQGSATVAPETFRRTYPSRLKQARPSATSYTTEENAENSSDSRTFAVLLTQPGENPWDLGPYRNWKSVMGNNILDWFLPAKHSPCADHSHGESAFPLGRVVERSRLRASADVERTPISTTSKGFSGLSHCR
jgi:palmitoyltransferase